MKHVKNFDNLNENIFSRIAKKLINNWEKLAIYEVSTPYVRTTFGITTDKGTASGYLTIYVEREKKKVKAVADYGIGEQEFDIDTVYMKDADLEKFVDWAYTTDLSISLRDHIKMKWNMSVLRLG